MRLKRKFVELLNVSLIMQSILLTGCVGNEEEQSSQLSTNPRLQQTSMTNNNLKTGPNDDNDIWTNIVQNDAEYADSNLSLVGENQSNYNVEFVGCESSDDHNRSVSSYVGTHLNHIPAGYSFPRASNYPSKWSYLDHGDGIYAESHIYDNSLHFHDVPKYTDGSFSCYYKIYVPETGSSLNFKIVDHWYNASSYDPAGKKLDKPQTDSQQMQSSSVLQNFIHFGPTSILTMLASGGTFAAFTQRVPSANLADYIFRKEKKVWAKFGEKLNRNLEILRNPTEYSQEEIAAATNFFEKELSTDVTMLNMKSGNVNVDTAIKGLVNGDSNLGIPKLKLKFKDITLSDVDANDNYIYMFEYQGLDGKWYPLDTSAPFYTNYRVAINPIKNPVKVINSTDNIFNVSDYINDPLSDISNYKNVIINAPNYGNYYSPEYGELVKMDEVPTSLTMDALGLVSSVGSTVGLIALQYFLFDPLFGFITGDPGIGQFNTGVNHIRIDTVSNDDANKWNSSHDQNHQIQANTQVTNVTTNSVLQQSNLSFTDSSIDKQLAVSIKLENLSNPWVRYEDYHPDSGRDDPYFGSVGKTGATHKYDAGVILTITDNQASGDMADLNYQYEKSQLAYLGLTSLANDDRLPAPSYSVNSINNSVYGKLIYSSNRSNLLNTKGLTKVGDSTVLVLNSGQDIKLNVSIPSTSLSTKLKDSQMYGGGFEISYSSDDDESEGIDFMPIKSVSLKASLDSESDIIPYLYSNFNCSYPLAVGTKCPLDLSIGGVDDGKHHMGKLYLADANSKTTYIPVFVNYHLLSQPTRLDVDPNDPTHSNYIINVGNYGAQDYNQIVVSGLPTGASANLNGCANGLPSGTQCQIELDGLETSDPGTYSVMIYGLTTNSLPRVSKVRNNDWQDIIPEADQESLNITVEPNLGQKR